VDCVEEVPRRRRVGKRLIEYVLAMRPRCGMGDVRGLQGLGVPGHQATRPDHVEAHRQLLSLERSHRGLLRVTLLDGIAPQILAWLDRDAVAPTEGDPLTGPGHDGA